MKVRGTSSYNTRAIFGQEFLRCRVTTALDLPEEASLCSPPIAPMIAQTLVFNFVRHLFVILVLLIILVVAPPKPVHRAHGDDFESFLLLMLKQLPRFDHRSPSSCVRSLIAVFTHSSQGKSSDCQQY